MFFVDDKIRSMKINSDIKPCLKWVGGKRQLLPELLPLMPEFDTYCEPFFGGGAVCFAMQPKKAIINDANAELINVYKCIKNSVEELIEDLNKHKNEAEYFYELRGLDRDCEKYKRLTAVQKASRFIYLNKTCFNGLYRVNRAGQLNSPFGRYKKPNIVNEECLRALSVYFGNNDVQIMNCDYKDVLSKMTSLNSFVYLDPPYDPVSNSANFTGYTASGFNRDSQIQLKKSLDELNNRGINFMLSNSATEFIMELYAEYSIKVVKAKRAINSKGNKRGEIDEVVIRNYE